MENKTVCPICKTSEYIKLLYKINKFHPYFEIAHCERCSLLFKIPFPNKEEIHELYNNSYYTGKGEYGYKRVFEVDAPIWNARLEVLEKYIRKGNLLDIGCGEGHLLRIARRRGWNPYGIEISPFIAQKGIEHRLDIFVGQPEDAPFPANSFEVITMFEVIEHVNTPINLINKCKELIKNNGILVIQTANMSSLMAKLFSYKNIYFNPVHLCYYDMKSMELLLSKTGFKILKWWPNIELNLFSMLSTLRPYFPVWKMVLQKLASIVKWKTLSINSTMVVYARKN